MLQAMLMQTPESIFQLFANYGPLGILVVLLLSGMVVTRGHLDIVRLLADRAMLVSEKQVEATARLTDAVEKAVEELRQQTRGRRT